MRITAFAAAFAAVVGVSGIAPAADLSLKDAPSEYYSPVALWSGLYIGGHIGGVRGNSDVTDTYDYYGDPTAKNSVDSDGTAFGGQLGYNFRKGHVVYGIEADIGKLDLSGTTTANLPVHEHPLKGTYTVSGGLYGDLTGRLGYATDKALIYAKGGVAFLKADVDAHYDGGNYTRKASQFDFSNGDTLSGWTIGAGVEYSLTSALSLKAEYQHFDFGSLSYDYAGKAPLPNGYHSTLTGNSDVSLTADAVTVGLNYNLSGGNDKLK